ncbi:LysE family translocator [Patescibacteria group bacterium]|nr:LysE family translocator [Patescibacteria group bacterium]
MNTVFQGILLGLSIAAPIGPTNIEIIRRGLKHGWKSATSFYLGVIVALVIYLLFAVFGLAVLTQSKIFNISVLFFGVLVLFYLSYNSFKDFFAKKELDLSGKVDSKKNFIPGIILTISNPAVLLFWTGIMGASLASSSNSLTNGLALSFGILVGVVIFAFILIPIIHGGRRFITQKNFKYVSLASGLILLYFAIKFGYRFIAMVFNI